MELMPTIPQITLTGLIASTAKNKTTAQLATLSRTSRRGVCTSFMIIQGGKITEKMSWKSDFK